MKNKGLYITIGVIVLLIIIIWNLFGGTYNKMIEKRETVKEKWSQVENVYQRRADLIPNLVNTVKGYADHEKETLQGVIEARSKATSVNIDAGNLDPESMQKFQQAQQGLSGALSRLMMVSERYPDLKANQSFQQLQSQLEGTENRISVERRKFNQAVKDYNTYIKKFPQNIIANMYGFESKEHFKSEKGAEKAPDVKF